MSKVKIFALFMLCVLCLTSAMANVAIDEDFDSGSLFADVGGLEPKNVLTTVQGVNVIIDSLIRDGAAYGGAGAPINFSDAGQGAVVAVAGGVNCYRLAAGQSLQFGTMDALTWVNGNIPFWGDGTAQMQAALAVNYVAMDAADGAVVGKLEIAFDGLSLTSPANLKKQTYELRKDSANNEVDIWAINNAGTAVKVFDGLNGANWANIGTFIFCRGLQTTNDGAAAKWGVIGKGPELLTVMATPDPGDSARVSVFINSNAAIDAARWGWTASNEDGRLATDGRNDGRIMGVRFTAGANNPLYIDNVHLASDRINWDVAYETPGHNETNLQGRLNEFTAPTQDVPQDTANATHWLIY